MEVTGRKGLGFVPISVIKPEPVPELSPVPPPEVPPPVLESLLIKSRRLYAIAPQLVVGHFILST